MTAPAPRPPALRVPCRRWTEEEREQIERHLRERGVTRLEPADSGGDVRKGWAAVHFGRPRVAL